MKKSEHYTMAMAAVVECDYMHSSKKIEIIETLLEDRKMARYREEKEAEKNEPESV